MANPPPPYANIAGISAIIGKYNEQETIYEADGNARPGQLVVNLATDPPQIFIGNNVGNLNQVYPSLSGSPSGNSGAVQMNWLGTFSNQGGTPGDTYTTMQFDGNGMLNINGNTAYQQRVDYSPYIQILSPRVESTDFGIIAGPSLTLVGYDDSYNTPRSAYYSVQDQSNVTQQWDFGILGNGSNTFSVRNRTANSIPLVVNTDGTIGSQVMTVADLPVATTSGLRTFVSDSNRVASGNFGATIAAGGSNIVPVYSNGANWLIG